MTVEEMEKELFATRYWLKYLFLITAPHTTVTSSAIVDQVRAIKNQDPEQFPNLTSFDELQAERVPAVERLGGEIAAFLANNER